MDRKYKLVCFTETNNEIRKQNLDRFIKNIFKYVNTLIVHDHNSTDGTYELLSTYTEFVYRTSNFNESVLNNFDTDYILYLNPDETFPENLDKNSLLDLCTKMDQNNHDSVLFKIVKIWNSKTWALKDDINEIKLKRRGSNNNNLYREDEIVIINYCQENYKKLAYRYFRDKIKDCLTKPELYKFLADPEAEPYNHSIEDMFNHISCYKDLVLKPDVSFICIIEESDNFLNFYQNFLLMTNLHDNLSNKEFFFVFANNLSNNKQLYFKCNRIPHYIYNDVSNLAGIYKWAALKAEADYIMFLDCRMMFTKNWFNNLFPALRIDNSVWTHVISHHGKDFPFKNFLTRKMDFINNTVLKKEIVKSSILVYQPSLPFNMSAPDLNRNMFIICNDYISGRNGEKVLWQYLVELAPNNYGVDMDNVKPKSRSSFEGEAADFIEKYYNHTGILLQNASFLGNIRTGAFKICYLQDNFRKMKYDLVEQENNLKNCNLVITNSVSNAASYLEYDCTIVPIGVDEELFKPMGNKLELRRKYDFDRFNKIGIFVGEFTNIKGWSEIKNIIDSHQEIFWIVVSKNVNDHYNKSNSKTFNKINQHILSELLNCADFYILGSPVETLCLAAIEACLCDIPVIMHNTGIFYEFDQEAKNKVGIITDNFEDALSKIYNKINSNEFSPRNVMINKELTNKTVMKKWERALQKIQLKLDNRQYYKN